MRLVDADALHMHVADVMMSEGITWLEAEIVHDFLDNAPTIEAVEVRHGKWERSKEDGFDQLVKCTACGEEFVCTELDIIEDLKWGYCPNCGAKMEGVRT